jgi:hypothetical protein
MKKYIVEMGVIVSIILIVGINPAFAALSNTLIIQNTNVISTGNDLRITGELVNLGTEPISGVKISMIDKSISVTPRFLDRIIIEPGERIPFAVEVLKTDLGEQLSDLTVIEGSAADQSVRYEDFNVGQSEIVWFDDLAKAANSSARPWANPVVVRNIGNSTAQVFGVTVIYDEAGNILEVGLTSDLARDEEENKATILKPGEVVMINSFGNLPASIADKDVHHEVLVWGKVVDSEPSKGELQYIDDHNDQNTPLLFAPFLMLGSVAGVSGWIAYRRIKPRKLALLALALIILIFVPSIATIFATDVAPPWDGGNGNPPSLID